MGGVRQDLKLEVGGRTRRRVRLTSARLASSRMDSIDNYQVLHLIGKGGFASVFKAK